MRRLALVLLLVLAACSRSPLSPPTSPSPAPRPSAAADFSGLWTGTFRLTRCSGERHCVLFIGTTRPFTLRLLQDGSRVHGLFTQGYTADVAGDVLADGSVVLTGTAPAASINDGSMRVTGVALRLTPARSLEGTVAYDTEPNPTRAIFEPPTSIGGEIVSGTRTDLRAFASEVDGMWRGRYVIRSCVPTGPYCYPNQANEVVDVQLSLARSGDTVSGTFTSGSLQAPVSGRIAGASVTLSGEALTVVSGGSTLTRLTSWTGSIDEFGRMIGTFRYEFFYPSAAPTLGESATAELWQVLKVP